MRNVVMLASGDDLVGRVASLLLNGGGDLSKSMVVFPGKRPAHFLRRTLAEQLGSAFLPPKVFSIEAFIEFVCAELLHVRRIPLGTPDMLAVLYDVHRAADTKLGENTYLSLDAFLPVGRKLARELEEVKLSNLPDTRVGEILGNIQFPKFQSLAYYYRAFYREVERLGYTTRSSMYRAVADRIGEVELGAFDKILFAGFYAFTPVEREIVRGLRSRDNVTFVFQQGIGIELQLKAAGMDASPPEAARRIEPSIHFYQAPDTHGQVFALAAHLQSRVNAGEQPGLETAIVVPSSGALFPVVHHALSLLPAEEYNIALGYPVTRTPVYGFLNSLLELVVSMQDGKLSSARYLTFALHPYTKNIRFGQRSDVTRILFHAIEEHLVNNRAKLLFSLDDLEGDTEVFDDAANRLAGAAAGVTSDQLRSHLVNIHSNTIRQFSNLGQLNDFARRVIALLTYVFENSTANLHPYFRPYIETLLEVFETLGSSLLAGQRFSGSAGYLALLRTLIAGESVPFSGTPLTGLQVLGLLETRNLTFDVLYIIDATDDVIPGQRETDVLLPQPVRVLLGLETHRDRERLVEYYFNLAVKSAKEVHLFYTDSGGKEKSRFVEKLLWQQEQRDRRPSGKERERVVRYGVHLANARPAAIAKTARVVEHIKRTVRFSALALDTYLRCQLRFYYHTVLHLREKEDATDELDAADVGSLVHAVLATYFEPTVGRQLVAAMLTRERLETVVDTCFREEFGIDVSGSLLLMRRQIREQLWRFVRSHQLPLVERERVMITRLETTLNAEKNGFAFTGRVDRIEMRGDRWFILDYKTAKNDSRMRMRPEKLTADRETWAEAIPSFQLPLYMLLYDEALKKGKEHITPAYVVLGKNGNGGDWETPIADASLTAADIYHRVEPILFKLLDEIVDVTRPFEPTVDLERNCPRCPYAAICGTQWVR